MCAASTFQDEEYYVCIHSHRYADTILFHHEGGVDIGDVDAKVMLTFCRFFYLFKGKMILIRNVVHRLRRN